MFSCGKRNGGTCAGDPFHRAGGAGGNRDRKKLRPHSGGDVIDVELLHTLFCELWGASRAQPEVVVESDRDRSIAPGE